MKNCSNSIIDNSNYGGNTMIYVYSKSGTNKQKIEQERSDIYSYLLANNLAVDEWIEESIIGLFCPKQSNLKGLIKKTKKRDLIICSDVTKIGTNFLRLYNTLLYLTVHGVVIYFSKDKYLIKPNFISGFIVFIYSIHSLLAKSKYDKRNFQIYKNRLSEYQKLKLHCNILGKNTIKHKPNKVMIQHEQAWIPAQFTIDNS